MNIEEESVWYAMRVTYRRELIAQRMLDDRGIENYIPKKYVRDPKHPRRKILVPVIHNLIFVNTRPSVMRQLKTEDTIPFMQYMMDRRSGQKILVPEAQMRQFIAVTADYDESLLYFSPDEVNLSKGTRVRVTGGPMAGREGVFVKVKGARDRRLVIEIEGIIAVAKAVVHPELIQVLDGSEDKQEK
ncbi:MAG: UpxY family transcription antiterminator [Candidatus Cryptobacteroides sp.]